MIPEVPMVPEFPVSFRGRGKLVSEQGEFPLAAFTLTKPKYAYGSPWQLTGSVQGGNTTDFSRVARLWSPFRLEGRTDDDLVVSAISVVFSGAEISGTHFTANVEGVQVGPGKLSEVPDDQSITVFLTPTDMAPRPMPFLLRYWSGEVKGHGEKAKVPKWTSTVGTFDLFSRFVHESAVVAGVEASVSIPRSTLFLSLKDGSRTADVDQLVAQMAKEVEPLVRLLSFLGRHHVDWCEIEILSMKGLIVEQETRVWKTDLVSSSRPTHLDPLADPRFLAEFGLDTMLQNLFGLPYHEAVLSSVGFLVGAHEGYLESRVMNSFTALETIVSAITEDQGTSYTLTEEEFGKIRPVLKNAIKQHGKSHPAVEANRATLYAKLGELRRAPIISQIIQVLEQRRIEWEDLWPVGSALESELRQAYGRRSLLIHSGMLRDHDRAVADTYRMHALTERLLYRILGGDPEWMSHFAYDHVSWLRGVQ